jgi:hypothetical protein
LSARTKLVAFGGILTLVLVAALGLGAAVGPLRGNSGGSAHGPHSSADGRGANSATAAAGLSSSDAGYTLALDDPTFTRGVSKPFTFRIVAPDGHPVTSFDIRHERALHLIVVSSDLADYQHVHPEVSRDGIWTTKLALSRAGIYRAYADFAPAGGAPHTLRAELTAAGELVPQPLAGPSKTATVGDYGVTLVGNLSAGAEGQVVFRVQRGFEEVNDLEPYLGAYGHLVAIRASDGAYLHVHPTDASSPRAVAFAVEAPSPGKYRLFLDFQHRGVVRSAAFTLDVPATQATGAGTTGGSGHGGH